MNKKILIKITFVLSILIYYLILFISGFLVSCFAGYALYKGIYYEPSKIGGIMYMIFVFGLDMRSGWLTNVYNEYVRGFDNGK